MNHFERLASELTDLLRPVYPTMQIRAEAWSEDASRVVIYFVEPTFEGLYPRQRYHKLLHHIPKAYFEANLANAIWVELAPGESQSDLEFPSDEEIGEITSYVMKCVHASGFLPALDDAFCPQSPEVSHVRCFGDFRHSKELLLKHRFDPAEIWDALHVLMAKGAYCDCEILYNVTQNSRLRERYWKRRATAATSSEAPTHEA